MLCLILPFHVGSISPSMGNRLLGLDGSGSAFAWFLLCLQKRALKLQQQRRKDELEHEQRREKELERERQLIAKPAKLV